MSTPDGSAGASGAVMRESRLNRHLARGYGAALARTRLLGPVRSRSLAGLVHRREREGIATAFSRSRAGHGGNRGTRSSGRRDLSPIRAADRPRVRQLSGQCAVRHRRRVSAE
jgi:hypothetical protein